MRRALAYFVTFVLLSFFFTVVLYVVTPANMREDTKIAASPIPSFLSLLNNKQVTLLDLWLPAIASSGDQDVKASADAGADIVHTTATSALMYDLTTGETLYEHNAHERLPMASLTKIMTAIVALENRRPDDRYTVYQSDIVGEDSIGIKPGEVFSLNDLLYGLILHSGNDAAEVMAHNYTGGRAAFIEAMNEKAKALGLTDTLFPNPTGLQGDGLQYTTAYDLLVMTKYALENFPEFRTAAATVDYTIPKTSDHDEYDLENETNLVSSYPGVKGVKTGYTPEAGLCLVTYLDYGGHQLIGVLLNSQDRRGEMKNLLDYSLKQIHITPPVHD